MGPIWLVVEPPTPLKNEGVKVSRDHDIPNISQPDGKITHVPNHQPDMLIYPYKIVIFHGYVSLASIC